MSSRSESGARWQVLLGSIGRLDSDHSRVIYVTAGFLAGLGNVAFEVFRDGAGATLARVVFMVVAWISLTLVPIRPRWGICAYSVTYLFLIVWPATFATDFMVMNLAFLVFLGRYLPLPAATAIVVGIACFHLTVAHSLGVAPTVVWLFLFLAAGLVPAGALIRWTERSERRRRADLLERIQSDIAREMHDVVAYSMSQTALKARRAAADVSYPLEARREFAALEMTAMDSLHELRLMLHVLRPIPGDDSEHAGATSPSRMEPVRLDRAVDDLGAALRSVVDDVASVGFRVTLESRGELTLTRVQATTLSRVAREMGANVIRHGDLDEPATFALLQDERRVRLISTNGIRRVKRSSLPSSGMGLLGMRERMVALGGQLNTLQEGSTWITSASVPCTLPRSESVLAVGPTMEPQR